MKFEVLSEDNTITRSGYYDKTLHFLIREGDHLLKIYSDRGDLKSEQYLSYIEKKKDTALKVVYAIGDELAYVTNEETTPMIDAALIGEEVFCYQDDAATYYNDAHIMSAYFRTDKTNIIDYIDSLTAEQDVVNAVKKINRVLDTQFKNHAILLNSESIRLNGPTYAIIRDIKNNKILHRFHSHADIPYGDNILCRIDAYQDGQHAASKFLYLFDKERRELAFMSEEENKSLDIYALKNRYLYEESDEEYTRYRLIQSFERNRYLLAPPSIIEITDEQYLFDIGSDEDILMTLEEPLYIAISPLNDYSSTRTYRMQIQESEFTISKKLIKMMGDPSVCLWLESDSKRLTPIVYLSEDETRTLEVISMDSSDFTSKNEPYLRQLKNAKVIHALNAFSGSDSVTSYDIIPQFISLLIQDSHTQEDAFPCAYYLYEDNIDYWDGTPHKVVYDKQFKRLYINDEDIVQYIGFDSINQEIKIDLLTGDYIPVQDFVLTVVRFFNRNTLTPSGLMVFQPTGESFESEGRYVSIIEEV